MAASAQQSTCYPRARSSIVRVAFGTHTLHVREDFACKVMDRDGGTAGRDEEHRSTHVVPRLLAQQPSSPRSACSSLESVKSEAELIVASAAVHRIRGNDDDGGGDGGHSVTTGANSSRRSSGLDGSSRLKTPRFTTMSNVLWALIAVAVCRGAFAQIPSGCRHALEESCPFATTNATDCETCASTSHGSKGRPVDTCGTKSVTECV